MADVDDQRTPYFEKEVNCPICGRDSIHYYLKDRMYMIEEREDDSFIRKYRWVKPEFSQFEPYSFYFWHCVHCKFTDSRDDYLLRARKSVVYDDHLKTAYLEKYQEDEVIYELSRFIQYPLPDYYSTLSIHMLAIYIQMLPVDFQRNLEKIARYFHRSSWMFRLEKAENRRDAKELLFNEFISRYDALQSDYVNMLSNVEEMNQWFEQQINFEKEKNVSEWSFHEERLSKIYTGMTKQLDKLLSGLQAYSSIGLNYKQKVVDDEGSSQQKFHEYKSFVDFLVHIKSLWPSVPMNEFMATQKAIDVYQSIINYQILDDQKTKLFQIYKLIIHLYGRTDNFEEAYRHAGKLLNLATEFRAAAQKRIQRLEKIEDDRVDVLTLETAIKKSRDILEYAKESRDKYYRLWMEEQNKKAEQLYAMNRNLGPDELSALLRRERISASIIQKFIKEKEKENRKGIFQIFKF